MDYGDISNKIEQGICKLQRLYTIMTVMGIALLVLSWFTDLIEEDILPLSTLSRVSMICTSVYGVFLIILASVGTYGLKARNQSSYKGVYFGSLAFMVMCFIGCLLALTCYFADYKISLANFRIALGAYGNNKIPKVPDKQSKGVADDRQYTSEGRIKVDQALHQISLLISLCFLLYTFIMAALSISIRTTALEIKECNEILLRAARSFDPSNMLLFANQPRAPPLTPPMTRSNCTERTDFNTPEPGRVIEKENDLCGEFIVTSPSAEGNCENEESGSVIKDDEIKGPKKEERLI